MRWKAGLVMGALVIAATLAVLKHQTASSYEFVAIGGESNPCECTKRLEPKESWWSSVWK